MLYKHAIGWLPSNELLLLSTDYKKDTGLKKKRLHILKDQNIVFLFLKKKS